MNTLQKSSISHFAIVAKKALFWLSIVTSPRSVVSREGEVLALWRHIRLLLLMQISKKAILTNE